MRRLILALSCVPTLVSAQTSSQPAPASPAAPPSEMVLIPRALISPIEQAILHPHSVDVGDILTLIRQLDACVADNPTGGVVQRSGPDQCTPVTQALAAQAQELADAKKAATPAAKPN